VTIPFIDLDAQRRRMGPALETAILNVTRGGHYIIGPEVGLLEKELAAYTQSAHVVSCANGTDALLLVLMAKDIGPGDAVFVPAFTFIATAEVVALRGATPVFVDVDPKTFNMDPAHLEASIAFIKKQGKLKPKGVIPVDLFGLAADYDALLPIAEAQGLWLLGDGAQSFGARIHGKTVVDRGIAWTTSFFPAKPLGCYGDGGAIFTQDEDTYNRLISLRFHGKGDHRYTHVQIGTNSRLDTLQAAILLEKLKIYDEELKARQLIAERYTKALQDVAETPYIPGGYTSVWAQYTLLVKDRTKVVQALQEAGIPTMVYYPIPLSQQPAYKHYPTLGVPVSESLCGQVLSLPMHPYLTAEVQDFIISHVRKAL